MSPSCAPGKVAHQRRHGKPSVPSTLKRVLNLDVKWERLEKDTGVNLEKFMEPPQRERYLCKEELSRVLAALNDDGLSSAIRLLLFTGCRRNEIVSLKWNVVRLNEEWIFLLDTKNGGRGPRPSRCSWTCRSAKIMMPKQIRATTSNPILSDSENLPHVRPKMRSQRL